MTTDRTSEFEAQRTHLFGLAYRLLGCAEEAEDVVQDAFLRWAGADQGAIAVLPAWLAQVTDESGQRDRLARVRLGGVNLP